MVEENGRFQMLAVGQQFPDFQLKNQNGELRTLRDYAGSWLVLYVYPKDDTPGCTLQGKSFTEQKAAFDRLGVKVVGLSQDDVSSHREFCQKYSFTIELLADPEAALLCAAQVGQSEWKGTLYWDRTTFLVDPAGQLRGVYEKVNPEGHELQLLQEIEALQK
jgi:thioredoxin-dependent peroxiredoxin